MKKYFEILRKCPLFSNVTDEHIEKMLGCLGARVSFFDKKYVDLEIAFKNMDSDIEIDEVGFNSNKYGIGVYAPNKDACNSTIESVIIYRQGYYD